ncbi:DNA polymerase III subunit psi [Candidatus Ecksteinia adelgidicola]|nr:DNA polymerase III subunit psi [Candidatus Ecksteinia adelgidicola]
MTLNKDWLLDQLGLTKWKLRKSRIFQDKTTLKLLFNAKLLIISHILPDPRNILFCDILRSINLTPEKTYSLKPDQVIMLPKNIKCNSWRLGIKELFFIAGAQLYSPTLVELAKCPKAKYELWKQICYYEKYFYINNK